MGLTALSSVIAGLDPAIQVGASVADANLDHRVATLRVGPVMTSERNER
jgi:hypothetical protein